MNFSCTQCQRRYSIADEKVRGKTVKVRCKNCQSVISVEGPPEEAEESTRVVSLADVERLREQDRSLAGEDVSAATPAAHPSWEDEPTRTMPLRDTRAPWFVMVRNKQEGPLDEGALRELVEEGTVTPRSYFWQQGMPDWKRGADVPELAGLFSAPAAPEPAPRPEPMPEPTSRSATSWQPEPPPASQTSWQPEPRQPVAADPWAGEDAERTPLPGSAAPLGELFSDLDLPKGEQTHPDFPEALGGLPAHEEEPGVPLGGEEPDPMENTRAYVKKAGVERRNPAWKIALFVFLLLAAPVGVLYAVTELQLVPLRATRVDAQGRTVEQPVSVFSAEGLGELRELLLGGKKAPPAPPVPVPETKRPTSAKPEAPKPEAPPPQDETQLAVAALYAEGEKKDVGPAVREDAEVAAADSAEPSGPSEEQIARVVNKSQSAFKSCIDRALRKSPKLRGGKVTLTATVGSSGTVKRAVFDRKDLQDSFMGNCLKARARRMVFPAFSGDDVQVEIPLVITRSM